MKKTILILMASAGLAFTAAAQQPAQQSAEPLQLTLEDCLEYALGENYNRRSIKLNEEAREDALRQSKMERIPSLSASIGETFTNREGADPSWDGSYGISTGVTLFQGGAINHTVEKNRLSAEQATYETSQYDNTLTIQVLESFLTALSNEELLKYQQSVLTASEEQVKQGRDRYAAGQILESDYLLLEAQYAADRNSILQTQISRDNSLLALKGLMSMDPLQPVEIVYPDDAALEVMALLPSEDDVLARAMESMPDLRISDYRVEVAETGVKISRAAYFPTITMNASVGTGHAVNFDGYGNQLSDRLNEQVGVKVSIPIFNNNRTKSQVTQSRIALRQAELDRQQTELDLRTNVIQQYRDVVLSADKYRMSEVKQNAYSKSFDAYRAKFDAGAITTVELLQQQNNYISVVNEYIQNKYGFMLRRKVLDVYMGEPVTM